MLTGKPTVQANISYPTYDAKNMSYYTALHVVAYRMRSARYALAMRAP